jgi:hypothetical protein
MKTSLQIGCLYSLKSMANHDHLSSTAPDAWCQTTLYVPVLGQYLMAATEQDGKDRGVWGLELLDLGSTWN